MPSMKPDVSGGGGTSIAIGRHRPRAAYSALTPYSEDTLRSPIRVIRYQLLPEIRPPQSAVHLPPVTVPDAIARVPAGSLAFSGRGRAAVGPQPDAAAGGLAAAGRRR